MRRRRARRIPRGGCISWRRGLADVRAELERTETELRAARARMETAIDALAALEPQRVELEQERERMRAELAAARAAMQAAQQRARELAVQVESRRSAHASLETTIARLDKQLQDLAQRRDDLVKQLKDGEEPARGALGGARACAHDRVRKSRRSCTRPAIASEELDALLRERDARRASLDAQVESARAALDEARLAAQQVRVRRESVAEQLAATTFELADAHRRTRCRCDGGDLGGALEETKGKIERLGQVNLAAIGEFKEQSERKEYLDRQCKDLTDALETLESAMRKIDRETRSRFQDTFDRVNAGLKEKFPAPVRRRPRLSRADGRGGGCRRASPSWRGRRASATAPSASCRAARRRSPPSRWCSRSST